MVARILAAYDMADRATLAEGRAWYPVMADTVRALAEGYGIPFERAVGVLAVTSPQCSVSENIRITDNILEAFSAGKEGPPSVHFVDAIWSAWSILEGDFSPLEWHTTKAGVRTKAQKTRSFYRNILGETDYVTIDRWAARIAFGAEVINQPSSGCYRRVEAAYRDAAAQRNETPRDLQAIVWIVTRGKAW